MRIVILGAGPTGLGAGYRLNELGHSDWTIYEASDHIGGLAASHRDDLGFTYDIGGHVLFSHYPYFTDVFDRLMGDDVTVLERESWIRMLGRYVPYPFQNNIRHLPPEATLECLSGLIRAQRELDPEAAEDFESWIYAQFGEGIARQFMLPYNFKVWAHPPSLMSKRWIAERVSVIDLEHLLGNVLLARDDVSWGPNSTFKFPLYGGTGGFYERLHQFVDDHLVLNRRAVSIDPRERRITFEDGSEDRYDVLLSTMPLNLLVRAVEGLPREALDAAGRLSWTGGMFVGIGVAAPCPSTKCWLYFPEESAPFYRVTYLSNYSPHIAPDADHFLLLTETSYSPYKPENPSTIVERTIDGLLATGILEPAHRDRIVTADLTQVAYSYPVPTLERDPALAVLQPELMSRGIYSRGRFGAWLYEIGNMDHSFMQGVEFVDHALTGAEETVWYPVRAPAATAR
ncbi:MAG TPA: FAD-dependent oxidoreductase [Tepidiformaceae bacterium]|nr:FAD-dependent oxidoreductase [Tepidiformaceae bacterium]